MNHLSTVLLLARTIEIYNTYVGARIIMISVQLCMCWHNKDPPFSNAVGSCQIQFGRLSLVDI